MFRKSDLVLYLPMNGNLTDYSANGYTATNSGASLTTNPKGISNTAYDFADASDRIEFASSVGNAIMTAINTACTIMCDINITSISSGNLKILYHQWSSASGQLALGVFPLHIPGSSLPNTMQIGISNNGASSPVNSNLTSALSFGTWQKYKVTFVDAGSNVTAVQKVDSTSLTTTGMAYAKTNSTLQFRIGARNGDNTLGDFGKISNLMVFNKIITSTEEKYINQFGNYKRLA